MRAAQADVRRGRGAYLPELRLGLSTGAGYSRTFTGRNPLGDIVEQEDALESKYSDMSQSVSGGLTLFDGGARRGELRAARSTQGAAAAGAEAEALRMRAEVARRYWKAVQAERAIALEERLLESAREQLETTQRLLRVGVKSPVDVLGAEVKVAEAEQALERARGEHRRALLDLRQEMGVLDASPVRLVDEPLAPFDPGALDAAALVAHALAANPRIARAAGNEAAAGHRVRAAGASRWPTLAFSVRGGRSQFFEDYSGLKEVNPLNQSVGIGFDVTLPVFDGFRTSAAVAQARARLEGAQADTRAERLAVETEVRAALIDLGNAHRAAVLAERTAGLARQRLEMAQEQYRVGGLTFPELQDAVEGAARAEREALETRFDFAAALATLEEKVGAPVAVAAEAR